MQKPDLALGRYQHFKGGEYLVLNLARDSETERWMVVYQTCYGDRGLWIRPLESFIERVEWRDGSTRPRFVKLEECDSDSSIVQGERG